MEYINYDFEQTNGKFAKAIVLFLSKDRYQEKARPEIQAYLSQKGLQIDDEKLEKKLKRLVRGDILCEGSSAFRFKGIPDDLFNHIFQVLYAEEIENVRVDLSQNSNQAKRESVSQKIFQQNKGYFLEFMIIRFLKYQTVKKSCPLLQELIQNPPRNANFYPYQMVGERHYNLSTGYHRNVGPRQFDVLAKTVKEEQPSILVECKYQERSIGSSDVEIFARKVEDLSRVLTVFI